MYVINILLKKKIMIITFIGQQWPIDISSDIASSGIPTP
jgi:hypothetical protein